MSHAALILEKGQNLARLPVEASTDAKGDTPCSRFSVSCARGIVSKRKTSLDKQWNGVLSCQHR